MIQLVLALAASGDWPAVVCESLGRTDYVCTDQVQALLAAANRSCACAGRACAVTCQCVTHHPARVQAGSLAGLVRIWAESEMDSVAELAWESSCDCGVQVDLYASQGDIGSDLLQYRERSIWWSSEEAGCMTEWTRHVVSQRGDPYAWIDRLCWHFDWLLRLGTDAHLRAYADLCEGDEFSYEYVGPPGGARVYVE